VKYLCEDCVRKETQCEYYKDGCMWKDGEIIKTKEELAERDAELETKSRLKTEEYDREYNEYLTELNKIIEQEKADEDQK